MGLHPCLLSACQAVVLTPIRRTLLLAAFILGVGCPRSPRQDASPHLLQRSTLRRLPAACERIERVGSEGMIEHIRRDERGVAAETIPWYAASTLTGLETPPPTNTNQVVIGVVDRAINRHLQAFRDRVRNPQPRERRTRSGQTAFDTYGWNFVSNDADTWTETGLGASAGHGTRVAGSIIAPRGEGMFGSFPDALVIPAVVANSDVVHLPEVVEALCYFIDLRQRGVNLAAVNLSLGFCENELTATEVRSLTDVVRALDLEGVLVVASATNYTQACRRRCSSCLRECKNHDICGYLPASLHLRNVVGVAAANRISFCSGSTIGRCDEDRNCGGHGALSIDLHGPAESVPSLDPNGSVGIFHGTSLAAPIVSAVAAMVVNAHPVIRGAALRSRILQSVHFLEYCDYRNRSCSEGIVNAPDAISGLGDAGSRCLSNDESQAVPAASCRDAGVPCDSPGGP